MFTSKMFIVGGLQCAVFLVIDVTVNHCRN